MIKELKYINGKLAYYNAGFKVDKYTYCKDCDQLVSNHSIRGYWPHDLPVLVCKDDDGTYDSNKWYVIREEYLYKKLPILHLHVKDIYFQQIKDKSKSYEYRLRNDYWKRRLIGKSFKEVHIHSGYPKKGDKKKTVIRKWDGFREVAIAHEHFGLERVDVFAIRVREVISK